MLHTTSLSQLISNEPEASVYKYILVLFARHKILDYTKNDHLCKHVLSEPQLHKLRMPSLVTAAEGCIRLSYDDLRQQLMVGVDAVVKQTILDAIAFSLVLAQMYQRQLVVEVSMAAVRDVHHGRVEHMDMALENWLKRTKSCMNTLDDGIHFLSVQRKPTCLKALHKSDSVLGNGQREKRNIEDPGCTCTSYVWNPHIGRNFSSSHDPQPGSREDKEDTRHHSHAPTRTFIILKSN